MPKWLDNLLGVKKMQDKRVEQFEMLSGNIATFSTFTGNIYDNSIYRSAVDSIARHIGKLNGTHVVNNDKQNNNFSKLNRILQIRPNPYMSSYDFLYKVASHYYLYNNAFILIERDDKGDVQALYPLTPSNVEFVVDGANQVYLKFLFNDGEKVIIHHDDVAIIRRFFNSNELLGDDNNAIMSSLELAENQNQGMNEAIKNSARIRGLLKYNQVLSPSKLKEAQEEFTKNYLTMANDGGVIPLDSNLDYEPLNVSDIHVDTSQMELVKQKVYEYLGINENIITGNYDEIQWQSFFESIIEPFAIQLSSELTEKIFTEREIAFSNRIVFESSKLQYSSNNSKTNVIKELLPLGVLTPNQALDLLNLPRVEDGDKRIMSLNYIDKDKATSYQLGKEDIENEGN
ncbi:phage portal protein [Staphylococcus massiliensis]|uniref:Portal protein, phage associated n=1 Tax=Staphylococcus massiliensis S46 TaxID=1229783 RepID=K9ADP5_9STAP|nr:phage portal protein [Staphylococcus massiliensis]EKU45389.1 portal protein, phage associated [Staphylococcus massiliensis S46]